MAGHQARGGSGAEELGAAIRRMMAVSTWMRRYYDARFEQLGLTAATARALLQVDPDTAVPTRDLAYRLSCDPSNVTSLVDRLERAGFIERHVDPSDRRIKTLVITADGRAMRERMNTLMQTDMPALEVLSAADLRTLLDLLDQVWAACEEHSPNGTSLARDRGRAAGTPQ
jgi:DNA-binding MarR family transcriptional regulator